MDESAPDPSAPAAVNVDAIQNLDTARMALRWALERIQKLDQHLREQSEALEAEKRLREKALGEIHGLQKTVSLRQAESDQRELYYAKLEEFLSLRLHGQADLKSLAEREVESQRLKELLEQKALQVDKEHQARAREFERDQERLRHELESALRERQRQAEQSLEVRRKTLDQEHLAKMSELRDREALLRQEERALAERREQFEKHYEAQRLRLQSDLKNFRAELEDQVKLRVNLSEQAANERHASIESAWSREKALLVKELQTWRAQAQELGPRLLEAERDAALLEEQHRKARGEADLKTMQLAERERAWQTERATLEGELSWGKQRLEEIQAEVVGLSEKLAEAQAGQERIKMTGEADCARLQERVKAAQAEREAVAAAAQEWRLKAEDGASRAIECEKRLAIAEENARLMQGAAERDVSMISERAQASERERQSLLAEIEEWKRRNEIAHGRAVSLQTKLAASEEEAARLRLDLEGAEARATERAQAAEHERKKLSAALTESGQRAEALQRRIEDLERAFSAVEENQTITERQLLRLEQQRRAWEQEREGLAGEITDYRARIEDELTRRLVVEKNLAIAEEKADNLRAAGERQAARFDERRKSWDEERALLLSERETLRQTAAEQAKRLAELERRLGFPPQQFPPPR